MKDVTLDRDPYWRCPDFVAPKATNELLRFDAVFHDFFDADRDQVLPALKPIRWLKPERSMSSISVVPGRHCAKWVGQV